MPSKKHHRYDDFPTCSSSSSKSKSKHCKSSSSSTSCYSSSSSSCYPSTSSCYSSSSSCKKGKCKCYNPYLGCNPCYPNPCNPCNPSNPYYPAGCVNPCANPCYNGNPCATGPCPIPCGPTSCNPCVPSPCNSIKTYNPFLYPNYTVYEITTSTYTIPSTACTTYYIYTIAPASSTTSTITLPQIASLDCGKKRNIVITNKGAGTVSIVSGGSDTFNGAASPYTLGPNSSVTLYTDTVSNWTVVGY